jgi:hypothetical protein
MWQMSGIPMLGALQFGSGLFKDEAARLEKTGKTCTRSTEEMNGDLFSADL